MMYIYTDAFGIPNSNSVGKATSAVLKPVIRAGRMGVPGTGGVNIETSGGISCGKPVQKPLKSLEQHNHEVAKTSRRATGIACPKCAKELYEPVSVFVFNNNVTGPYSVISCQCGWSGNKLEPR